MYKLYCNLFQYKIKPYKRDKEICNLQSQQPYMKKKLISLVFFNLFLYFKILLNAIHQMTRKCVGEPWYPLGDSQLKTLNFFYVTQYKPYRYG